MRSPRRLPAAIAVWASCVALVAAGGLPAGAQEQADPSQWEAQMQAAFQAELRRIHEQLAALGVVLPEPPSANPSAASAGAGTAGAAGRAETAAAFSAQPLALAGTGRLLAAQVPEPSLPTSPISLSGKVDDPDDTAGPLDIKQLRHGASTTQIAYEVDFYDAWKPSDLDGVAWLLDFNGDGREEGCIDTFWDGSRLTGAVFGNGCVGESITRVAVEQPTATTLRAVYDIQAIKGAGFNGTVYTYRVESNKREAGGLAKDQVPDGGKISVSHDLNAKGTITGLPPSSAASGSRSTGSAGTNAGATASGDSGAPAGSGAAGTGTQASGPLPNSGAPISDNARRGAFLFFAGLVLTSAHLVMTRRRGPVWEGPMVAPPNRRDRGAPPSRIGERAGRAPQREPARVTPMMFELLGMRPALPAAPAVPALGAGKTRVPLALPPGRHLPALSSGAAV